MTVEMTFEEWVAKYHPVLDRFGDVRMFETYGSDMEILRAVANPLCIWTDIDCDGSNFILNGVHSVNRLGYYITEIPETEFTQIMLSEPDEDEEDEDVAKEAG